MQSDCYSFTYRTSKAEDLNSYFCELLCEYKLLGLIEAKGEVYRICRSILNTI